MEASKEACTKTLLLWHYFPLLFLFCRLQRGFHPTCFRNPSELLTRSTVITAACHRTEKAPISRSAEKMTNCRGGLLGETLRGPNPIEGQSCHLIVKGFTGTVIQPVDRKVRRLTSSSSSPFFFSSSFFVV